MERRLGRHGRSVSVRAEIGENVCVGDQIMGDVIRFKEEAMI